MSESLTEFLLARIAEDERMWQTWSAPLPPTPFLADCEAKRRIVALHDHRCPDCGAGRRCIPHDVSAGEPSVRYRDPVDWLTLTALALPYADHPDYQPEWRP